jgi:hypothetical protein
VRGRDAHVGVQHTGATAHSCCGLEGGEDSILSIQRSQNAGGVARKDEASRGASNRKGARHIDTREHFVDQLVKDCIVKLVQCRTNKMVADALTKKLPAPAFEQHRATMLGEDEAPFSAMMCRV